MPRSEAAGDKFFRILRFSAPTVCTIHRESRRVVRSFAPKSRSFVRSFARSLARSQRKVRQDLRRADAVFLRLQESICIVLVSPLPVFPLSPDSSLAMPARFPTSFAFRGEFFPSPTLSAVRTTPMRQWFYLIALLCFIEQLLRQRAVCFFLRSLPETAVSVISEFNAATLPGLDS